MPLYDEKGRVTGAWDPKSGHLVHTPTDMPGNTAAGAGIGERGIETVSAQTPDGPVYESKAAADAAGHKILNKANPAEREKAKQAYTQYGRMIDNAQEAMSTMPAWKEGSKDRDLAMRVSKQFFAHIPVVGVDPTYVDQFLNSDDYRTMSKQGQAHMQNMFSNLVGRDQRRETGDRRCTARRDVPAKRRCDLAPSRKDLRHEREIVERLRQAHAEGLGRVFAAHRSPTASRRHRTRGRQGLYQQERETNRLHRRAR
jgi:hypothetical protein